MNAVNGNCSSANQPEQISPATAFALSLETACEQFETLQLIIKNEIRVTPAIQMDDMHAIDRAIYFRAPACVRMALAKSFVANVIRAHRVCDDGAQYLAIDRQERKRFLKATPGMRHVRDVNEHGYDVSGNEDSKPSMHHHELESASLDETSMVILGPEKILMGPLNLYDAYLPTARMREIAGFVALSRKETLPIAKKECPDD